ncbi:hypothetical protein [Kamptonema formosum]|uniref:hypothetical protein n=1 Tax=Kamptonema formosum TaxID=331992 RepID=UPI00034C6C92|nr:hypothetical protein [Oscillatoria sp. PCC 10802]
MEPAITIAVFLKWLQDNPAIFLPNAWKNLPQLESNLTDFANDPLFSTAQSITKWCAQNGLGEKLRHTVARGRTDIEDLPEFDTSDTGVIENIVPTLRSSIQEAYETLQKEAEQQQPGSQND